MATALGAFGLAPARGLADDAGAVELATRAKKDCLGGHVEKGIEILADLYTSTNDPNYLYNQARCFEQNGRAMQAIGRFREYLRKASNVSDSERKDIEKRIEELQADIPAARAAGAKGGDASKSSETAARPGEAAKSSAPAGPKPTANAPAASPKAPATPAAGSDSDDGGALLGPRLMAALKEQVAACYEQYHVPGVAVVDVNIDGGGAVTGAQVSGPLAGTETGACVTRAVERAHFPTKKGVARTKRIKLVLPGNSGSGEGRRRAPSAPPAPGRATP